MGTWRQDLKQRAWRNTAYWLTSPSTHTYILDGLPSLLSYALHVYLPRHGAAPSELAPLISSLRKCPTGNPKEPFSQLRFSFPNMSRLLLSWQKPTSTSIYCNCYCDFTLCGRCYCCAYFRSESSISTFILGLYCMFKHLAGDGEMDGWMNSDDIDG